MKNKKKSKLTQINKKENYLDNSKKLEKISKKIGIIVIFLGLIFGLLLINFKIEIDKSTLFEYIQFLILACILGLLLDTRNLIKKCASKP